MLSEYSIIILTFLCMVFILYCLKLCLNSKCDNCNFFGIKIHRNIKLETDIEKYKIDHKIDDLEGLNNINNIMNNVKNNNIIK